MPIRPRVRPALRPMVFVCRRIPPKFVKGALSADTMGGRPQINYGSVHEALDDVFKPILVTLSDHLTKNGCSELIPLLPKYILFRVMLGMWRPRRVDDVWHPTSLCHHEGPASLLSRQEYYSIHRHSNCSSADLLEAINAHWSQLWVWGWAAAGDESIVPHKGKRAGPIRMFIPRKSHSTGIKRFVLSDSVHPFVTDIILHAGKRVRIFQGRENVAGPRTAREMVHRWVDLLPSRTALVCDSYFGSHAVAHQLARRQHPFLFLTRRDQEGVAAAGDLILPGQVAETYVRKGGYSLHVFKNPKVGSKPPQVVPFVSNCQYDGMRVPHRGGYSLPPIVAAYRHLANGVDSANQLALEHRETSRLKCWSKALKAFLYRYAIVNTFTVARCQGLISQKKSLWDFQWDILEVYVQKGNKVHAPVLVNSRGTCVACGGRTWFKCAAFGVSVHSYHACFAPLHSQLKK